MPDPVESTQPDATPQPGAVTGAPPAAMPNLGALAPQPQPPPRESFKQGLARGGAGETYAVDAQGNVVNTRRTSPSARGTFGSILAGAVMGALAGAGGHVAGREVGERENPVGEGVAGAKNYMQQRDERARGRAQTDFENRQRVTEATNKDLMYKAEIHIANLNAIKLAHEIDRAKVNDPIQLQQLTNALTASSLALDSEVKNLGLVNERTFSSYAEVPQADIAKFNRHEVKLLPLPDGTVKVWDRTFDARGTPNAADFEIRDLAGLDPKTGKPDWRTVGHVKAGGGTVAQQEAELDKQRTQLLDAAVKNAMIEKERAQAGQARAAAVKDYSIAEMNKLMLPGSEGGEAANGLIDAAYNLQVDPTKIASMRTNMRQIFMTRLLARHPDFNMQNYDVAMAAKKAYTGGGKVGQNLGNFSTAIEHLNQLSQIYDAMQGGDLQLMNRLAREAGYQTGATPKAAWNIVTNALADELERAYTGVGATQEGAKSMKEGFSVALSQGQAKTAIRSAMATLKSRENSLRGNFVNAMPPWFPPEKRQPEAQGINLLSPQASQVMEQWGFKSGAPSPTDGDRLVIKVGDKQYRYNGNGDTTDIRNYTEVTKP